MPDFKGSSPLDEERLFILAVRHCLRDGVLDVRENKLLKILIRFLRIDHNLARELLGKTLADARAGRLADVKTPMEPNGLYVEAVRLACEDGILEEMEEELLVGLATALGLSETERTAILDRARGGISATP